MGAAIISRGDCVEFLLARGIPQHQSNVLAVHPAEQTMLWLMRYRGLRISRIKPDTRSYRIHPLAFHLRKR